MEKMPISNGASSLPLREWREQIESASRYFESTLAQSMAVFQNEIQEQHIASLRYLHDEIWHLRASSHVVDGKKSFKREVSYDDTVQIERYYENSLDGTNAFTSTKYAVGENHSGPHPNQLAKPPVAPPAAPPPPELMLAVSPPIEEDASHIGQILENSTCMGPIPRERMSQRNSCPHLSTVVSEMMTGCQSTHFDDAVVEEIKSLPSGASTPSLSEAMRRWEFLVGAYAFDDLGDDSYVRAMSSAIAWVWEIQEVWLHKECRKTTHPVRRETVRRNSVGNCSQQESSRATKTGDRLQSQSWMQGLILEPSSEKRLVWSLLGVIMILWDLVMIPMGSFVDWTSAVLVTFGLVTTIYWALDTPLNFFVGFLDLGLVELRPAKVATRYLKTWFGLDSALVTIDLLMYFIELDSSQSASTGAVRSAKTVRMGRVFRLVRGVRLLRLMKLSQTFSHLMDNIQSEYQVQFVKLCIHLAFILGINHYVACGWFTLAREIQSGFLSRSETWIDASDIHDADPVYQYLMSLHWSVTQFTPATNDINPTCAPERAYAILVVLFALVTFSSFVSSVTNTVNEMRRINMERITEEARIREFISKRKVSQDLAMRVWHFFRQNYMRRRRVVLESDIRFLREVPQSLMAHLHEEMYMPVLRSHAVFNRLITFDKGTTMSLCHSCFYDMYEVPKQDIFVLHAECHRILFVREGRLIYRTGMSRPSIFAFQDRLISSQKMPSGGSTGVGSGDALTFTTSNDTPPATPTTRHNEIISVNSTGKRRGGPGRGLWKRAGTVDWATLCECGRWVSEPALWVKWRHYGQLSTETFTEIIALDFFKLQDVFASIDGRLWHALKAVAVFFAEFAENETQSGREVTDTNIDQALLETFAQRSITFQNQRNAGGILSGTRIGSSVFQQPKSPTEVSSHGRSTSTLMQERSTEASNGEKPPRRFSFSLF